MQISRLHQLRAMIQYEALLQFRRRGALAVILFSLVALILLTLLNSGVGVPGLDNETLIRLDYSDDTGLTVTTQAADGTLTTRPAPDDIAEVIPRWMAGADYLERTRTFTIILMTAVGLQVILIALLPVMAESIPIDKHFRMRELLASLPIPEWIYLAGKVIGAWLILFTGWLIIMFMFGIFYHLRVGSIDGITFVRIWLVLNLPAGLIMSGLTILAASAIATRRKSVLVGLALIPIALWMCVGVYLQLFEVFDPARMAELMHLPYQELIDRMSANALTTVLSFTPLLFGASALSWLWARTRSVR